MTEIKFRFNDGELLRVTATARQLREIGIGVPEISGKLFKVSRSSLSLVSPLYEITYQGQYRFYIEEKYLERALAHQEICLN